MPPTRPAPTRTFSFLGRRVVSLFKSRIGTFLHPQDPPVDLPFLYREIGTRKIASSTLTRSGLTNPRTPMTIFSWRPLLLIGNFPVGKSVLTRSQITRLAIPRFPIRDATCLSLAPWSPRYPVVAEISPLATSQPLTPIFTALSRETPSSRYVDATWHLLPARVYLLTLVLHRSGVAVGPVVFREIAVSPVAIPLHAKPPKRRTPTPPDPWTRVPQINGPDRVGKSLIAILTHKTPVSGIPILR
jgi:hypothetical protein